MTGPDALSVAVAIYREPAQAADWRQRRLPADVELLLRIACAEREALDVARARTSLGERDLTEAAVLTLQQLLFNSGGDAYRILGAPADAPHDQLRRHYRWLMKWLHPDRDGDGWESIYADRVNLAWQALKTPERRSRHDADAGIEALWNKADSTAADTLDEPRQEDRVEAGLALIRQRARNRPAVPAPEATRRTAFAARPRLLLSLLAAASLGVVGLVYLVQPRSPAVTRPSWDVDEVLAQQRQATVPARAAAGEADKPANAALGADPVPAQTGADGPLPSDTQAVAAAVEPDLAAVDAVAPIIPAVRAAGDSESPATAAPAAPSRLAATPPPATQSALGARREAAGRIDAVVSASVPAQPVVASTRPVASTSPAGASPVVSNSPVVVPPQPSSAPSRLAAAARPSAATDAPDLPARPRTTVVQTLASAPRQAPASADAPPPIARPPDPEPAPAEPVPVTVAVATASTSAPEIASPTDLTEIAHAPAATPMPNEPLGATQRGEPKVQSHTATALIEAFAAAYSAGNARQFDALVANDPDGGAFEQMRERLSRASMRYLEVGDMEWREGDASLHALAPVRDTYVPTGERKAITRIGQMRWEFRVEDGEAKIAAVEFRGQ
jgi:hypothetical protein